MTRIACFGEALIDFLAQPTDDPAAPLAFVRHAGGAPANVAVGVATLGADAAFVGMLGTDMFGDFLLQSLRDAGVDTRHVRRTGAAPTALAFVSLDAHGERSFSFHRPPAADLLFTADDAARLDLAGTAIFHACSNSLTEAPIADATFAAMDRACAHGALVSFDMNLRPMLWPAGSDPLPRLWAALSRADVVKLSAEEFAVLVADAGSDDAVRKRLWQGRARWLLVTDGGRPLRWFAPHGQGSETPFAVRMVDSTAAGDAFVAGLLTALAEQRIDAAALDAFTRAPERTHHALRFAAACGALAVTRRGAFAAMPRRAAVLALIDAPPPP